MEEVVEGARLGKSLTLLLYCDDSAFRMMNGMWRRGIGCKIAWDGWME